METGWIYLIIAGSFEGAFAFFLKLSNNFRNFVPSVLFFIFYILSAYLLSKAIQQIPLGTAYAVWTGIGAFLTIIIGILIFNEPTNFLRFFFLTTLIVSIIGLNLV
ncbi:MAG TPA: multidrug efflux SMR transporter [Halobacteria archaeon]|jgi:quaternary ammonium compound-resistance protein SugE|nr:multidrug efflux SMR transporter [Halobacteria archaeon]